MKFDAQKFYSISTFLGAVANNANTDGLNWGLVNSFFKADRVNNTTTNAIWNIGPIQVKDHEGYPNTQYGMIPNADISGAAPRFGANWLNFSVYFPQIGYTPNEGGRIDGVRVADFLATQWKDDNNRNLYFVFDNAMPIAAGDANAKWFGRSDLHWTDIIEVPLDDIIKFKTAPKGFRDNQLGSYTLKGEYRNGSTKPAPTDWKGTWSANCPLNGGKVGGIPTAANDPRYYFYKGFSEADCIEFLYDLGLVTE